MRYGRNQKIRLNKESFEIDGPINVTKSISHTFFAHDEGKVAISYTLNNPINEKVTTVKIKSFIRKVVLKFM